MIRATAPGYCAVIGDPTDMYGGSVIACSIKERACCTLDDSPVIDEIAIEIGAQKQAVRGPADLALRGDMFDAPRAVLSALEVFSANAKPFSLSLHGSDHLSSSLGRESAVLTAILGCVLSYLGLRLNNYEIAELVQKIESDLLGAPCGFLDQYMAAFGGLCYLDFREKGCDVSHDSETPFAAVEPLHTYIGDLPIIIATLPKRGQTRQKRKDLHQRWLQGDVEILATYQRLSQL